MSFDKKSEKRIARTVKKSEREWINGSRSGGGRGGRGSSSGRLVKITGRDGWKYSWTAQKRNETTNKLEDDTDITGSTTEDFAFESRTLSESVVIGDIVTITPSKGDLGGYEFDYTPGSRFATTVGEISANSSGPGWGFARIRYFDNETSGVVTTPEEYEVNNFFSRKVRQNGLITIAWDIRSGRWFVTGADCGATSYA